MQEVERRLTGLVAGIRESGATEFESSVRSSVRNIRFLLDSANQFWDRRRTALAPGVQYGAGGAVVESPSAPTFAFEL